MSATRFTMSVLKVDDSSARMRVWSAITERDAPAALHQIPLAHVGAEGFEDATDALVVRRSPIAGDLIVTDDTRPMSSGRRCVSASTPHTDRAAVGRRGLECSAPESGAGSCIAPPAQ
jgi:hypothetical protein